MIQAVAWSLALALAWILFGGRFGGRSRLLVSWILFGVRGGLSPMIRAVAWSLALAGFCLAVALDDLRGFALVLLR